MKILINDVKPIARNQILIDAKMFKKRNVFTKLFQCYENVSKMVQVKIALNNTLF